jgi:hypothetical protein
MTSIPSDERRIAGLLRELVSHSGRQIHQLEEDLGWEPGRLNRLLDAPGRGQLSEVLRLITQLQMTPDEFFEQLRNRPGAVQESSESSTEEEENARFQESRRVIEEAIVRRNAWKAERSVG